MKIVSYGPANPQVGVVAEPSDAPLAVHDVLLDGERWSGDMRALIEAVGTDFRRLSASPQPRAELASVAVTAPVALPSKVIAAPVNYLDHKAEMNEATHIDGLGVFLKAPTSVVGDHGVIRLPYDDRRFDQEGELALVIGTKARHVPVDSALSHVFGYTCLMDITMRGGEDRSTRKSFDTFTPMGPWLVTPDEVGDLGELRLTCAVNGQPRQDASIADLIWDVPALIAYASSVMTLLPGDVITTGTPAGVGTISEGDSVQLTISRIGTLNATVTEQGAGHCPTKGASRGPVPPATVTTLRTQ